MLVKCLMITNNSRNKKKKQKQKITNGCLLYKKYISASVKHLGEQVIIKTLRTKMNEPDLIHKKR